MGLTDAGYIRRTYDDILNDKIQRAKELFGEDIDTSDLTPLGKYLRINAYDQALAEEEIEAVYYSSKPHTASGQSLDRLLPLVGITRNPATPARYTVEVQGTAGYTIPLGFLVGTDEEQTFYSLQDATIGEDGTCLVEVCCTEAGSIGNINANAIDTVVNPDVNVEAVNGVDCVAVGTDEESDSELRARLQSAMQSGSGNADAIKAAVLRVPTVQYVELIENDSDTEDSDGRPPHSFECFVVGGAGYEQDVAKAIFSKKAMGIPTAGSNAVTVTDASGHEKVVRYSSAATVQVTVRVVVKTKTTFASDGTSQIQKNVAAYIDGLGIGTSVVHSALYGHIYKVTGVAEVTTLELSTDGGATFGTANIIVPQYGVAACSAVTVEVIA